MNRSKSAFFAALAVLLAIAAVWYPTRTPAPPQSTWEDVRAEAARGNYRLIETQELWRQYQSDPENLLLVDTRQEWEYRTGHIAGAVSFSMEPTAWARWRQKGPLKAFLGPDKDRPIVFY